LTNGLSSVGDSAPASAVLGHLTSGWLESSGLATCPERQNQGESLDSVLWIATD